MFVLFVQTFYKLLKNVWFLFVLQYFMLRFLSFSPDNSVRPGMDIAGCQTLPSRNPLSGGQRVGLTALGQITHTMKNIKHGVYREQPHANTQSTLYMNNECLLWFTLKLSQAQRYWHSLTLSCLSPLTEKVTKKFWTTKKKKLKVHSCGDSEQHHRWEWSTMAAF